MDFEKEPKSKKTLIISVVVGLLLFSGIGITGLPPTTLSGVFDSLKTVTFNFFAPNHQSTKVTGGTLLETGNKNLLANPSFEHSTATTSWTNNGAEVGISESTVVVDGRKSISFNPSNETINLVQSSVLYQAQFADGVQGLAMVRIKSAVALSVCSVQAGVVSTTNCVTTATDSRWGLYKIPFILGGTSNGISIAGSALTGAVYVDDAFVGAVDLKVDIDSSTIAGNSYIAGTALCSLSRTSTTIGPLTDDADCPGPTIVSATMGSWQTTDANNLTQTINNLDEGTYEATWCVNTGANVSNRNVMAVYDGTTQAPGYVTADVGSGGSGYHAACASGIFRYASPGNRSFQLYGAASSSTWNVSNIAGFTGAMGATFTLRYFGSGQIYTSQNSNTGWSSCGHTTSDFVGFGTVTTIQTQCRKDSGDLLMRGKITLGTTTATEARVNLKLAGTALTSASTSIIDSIQASGVFVNAESTANSHGGFVLIEPSTAYFTLGTSQSFGSATINPASKINGNILNTGTTLHFVNVRIPINGWENSNLIIGTFKEMMKVPGVSKPKTCYYGFTGVGGTLAAPTECADGTTCEEEYDTCSAMTPPTGNTGPVYNDLTIANGTYANNSWLMCKAVCYDTSSGTERACPFYFVSGDQSWSTNANGGAVLNIKPSSQSGTLNAAYVQVECVGSEP